MPRGQDYDSFSTIKSTGYVWGDQDDVFGRWAASTFQGATGPAGAAGTAGYVITDNSGASSDLLLNAGDIAYVNFTSQTSVPLHIQTVEGYYEIEVMMDTSGTSYSSGNWIQLKPNNANLSSGDILTQWNRIDNGAETTGANATGLNFYFGGYDPIRAHAEISTITKSKSVQSLFFGRDSATTIQSWREQFYWKDTTTAWTSLGTLALGGAQSGKVIIRRII